MVVYWKADGAGRQVGDVQRAFVRWIRDNDQSALIVNGGDVYDNGTDEEFETFFSQMDHDVSRLCRRQTD